jgi:hypothetical protein
MRASRGLRIGLAVAVCAGTGAGSAGAQASETASQSFASSGAEQQFVVPAGVTSVQVKLVGASGGSGYDSFGEIAAGGLGATGTATLAVTPGETLFVEVAGEGQSVHLGYRGAGGYNGGGAGGLKEGESVGGGGGGASDVRTCSTSPANVANPANCSTLGSLASRLAVAAGGGGGGDEGGGPEIHGGEGGGAGGPGARGQSDDGKEGGGGGAAGGQALGGAPGDDSTDGPAAKGLLGEGGIGGNGGFSGGGGGGGGGGIYGGGGGGGGEDGIVGDVDATGGGGGGGGGSSGIPTGVTRGSYAPEDTAPGVVPSTTFTWMLPAPTVASVAPQGVTGTGAVLMGTVNPNGSSVSDCHFSITPAPPSGGLLPCAQQVGAGDTPVAVSVAATGLTPGTVYRATLVAISAQGTSTGAPVTFETVAIACPVLASPEALGQPCGGERVATPPSLPSPLLSALKLSPTRFRRGTRAVVIATAKRSRHQPKAATATTISFDLSESASVSLRFERKSTGVTVGHSCVAPSKRHRRGKPCTLYVAVPGAVTFLAPAGGDRITFDGVLERGAHLALGSYRLTATASASGASSTAPQHPTFTLLR